jgi:hypothetical protein
VGEESLWHHRIAPSFPANLILVVGQAVEESSHRDADATEGQHFEAGVEGSTSCVAGLGETSVEVVE